ncbi:MAG: PGF-CTERM-anchored ABC transporter substrate-binding protein [Halobacteriaceae archaeon]
MVRTAVRVAVLAVVLAGVLPGVAGAAPGAGAAPPAAGAGVQTDCGFPVTATDATGVEVTVSGEPERVVTLAPSAAQTMWEIGAKEKVVGLSQYATYLEGADSRRNVSGQGSTFVGVEKVIDAEPDLVLAPNVVKNDTVEKLRDAGLTVYKFREAKTLEDIREKTRLTGELVGECEGAKETVAWMDERLETVRETVEGQDRPRVLYVFFGFTAGKGTFIHRMITTAGGENVAATANISGFKQVSPEVVVDRNPQWIVVNDGATGVPSTDAYNSTDAVKNDQILVVKEEHVSQPAPRVVHAIVRMAKAFHPDAYAAANRTTTATATTAATDGTTTATTAQQTAETTSAPGVPGFGVAAALAALAALALLASRGRR